MNSKTESPNLPFLLMKLAANEDLDTDSPQLSALYSDVDPVSGEHSVSS